MVGPGGHGDIPAKRRPTRIFQSWLTASCWFGSYRAVAVCTLLLEPVHRDVFEVGHLKERCMDVAFNGRKHNKSFHASNLRMSVGRRASAPWSESLWRVGKYQILTFSRLDEAMSRKCRLDHAESLALHFLIGFVCVVQQPSNTSV